MNLTIRQITEALEKAGKVVTRTAVYRHLEALNIGPLGARQRPQLYPGDTAHRLIEHLGLNGGVISVDEAKRRARKKGGRR